MEINAFLGVFAAGNTLIYIHVKLHARCAQGEMERETIFLVIETFFAFTSCSRSTREYQIFVIFAAVVSYWQPLRRNNVNSYFLAFLPRHVKHAATAKANTDFTRMILRNEC